MHQQSQLIQPPIYDTIATKSQQSIVGTTTNTLLGNSQTKSTNLSTTASTASAMGKNPFSTYDRNALDYRHLNLMHETNQQQNYHTLAAPPTSSNQQNHLLDFRQQQLNGTKFTNDYGLSTSGSDLRIANNTDLLNLSNSSIANQLLPNASVCGGSQRMHNATGTLTNKESNRNHHSNGRNHIITDTLPGPESCV